MGETGGEVMTRGMLFISPKWINKMLVIFVQSVHLFSFGSLIFALFY